MANQYVAYYRVSTKKQKKSGLGLEAQQEAVNRFLQPADELIGEFTEVESGKKISRAVLEEALALTKLKGAILVIAKLDRLARNVSFVFALRDSGVKFVCLDIPDANTLTIGVVATMAQHEREVISTRTKDGLAMKKAQGKILGTPANLTKAAALKGAAAMRTKARSNPDNRRAAAMIRSLAQTNKNYSDIARQLNAAGFTTSKGKQFQAIQVQRLQGMA